MSYGFIGLLLFQFFAEYNEVYNSWRGSKLSNQLFRIIGSWMLTLVAMLVLFFFTRTAVDTSRLIIATWSVVTMFLLITFHASYYLARIASPAERNTLKVGIVGATSLGHRLVDSFASMPSLGYKFSGYYDDRKQDDERRFLSDDTTMQGNLEQLFDDAQAGKLDVIYVTLPMAAEVCVREILDKLGNTTATVFYVPYLFAFNLVSSRCVMMKEIPCFSIYGSPFDQELLDSMIKRFEDIVLFSIILCLIVIPMFFIAIGVKLSLPGPVIFRKKRYGADGSEINVWKFRTMTVCEWS